MQYYKTITDEIYAYEDSINYQDYTDKVLTPLTEAEYLAIVTSREVEGATAEQTKVSSRLVAITSLESVTGLSIDTIREALQGV